MYANATGRLADHWKAGLGRDDYAGQVEIEPSWPEGYSKMTEIDAAKARK